MIAGFGLVVAAQLYSSPSADLGAARLTRHFAPAAVGSGLPPDSVEKRGQSLGRQLVSDLVKPRQATFALGPGAAFTRRFDPRAAADTTARLHPPDVP